MQTAYCINCGAYFQDGDRCVDRPDGTLHYECQRIEEAMEATWQDAQELF